MHRPDLHRKFAGPSHGMAKSDADALPEIGRIRSNVSDPTSIGQLMALSNSPSQFFELCSSSHFAGIRVELSLSVAHSDESVHGVAADFKPARNVSSS